MLGDLGATLLPSSTDCASHSVLPRLQVCMLIVVSILFFLRQFSELKAIECFGCSSVLLESSVGPSLCSMNALSLDMQKQGKQPWSLRLVKLLSLMFYRIILHH